MEHGKMVMTLEEYVNYLKIYEISAYIVLSFTTILIVFALLYKIKSEFKLKRQHVIPEYTKLGACMLQRQLTRIEVILIVFIIGLNIEIPYEIIKAKHSTLEYISHENVIVNNVEIERTTFKDNNLDIEITVDLLPDSFEK